VAYRFAVRFGEISVHDDGAATICIHSSLFLSFVDTEVGIVNVGGQLSIIGVVLHAWRRREPASRPMKRQPVRPPVGSRASLRDADHYCRYRFDARPPR